MSDEDGMILSLKKHKKIKNLLIQRLRQEGIECEETTGNDRKGDILIIKKEDAPRVQAIIRELQQK
jgi:hypothetical protein